MKRLALYHVTREQVARAIMREGIRPKMATGKMLASWYVERERVVWALAHVSARWQVSVDKLVVAEIDADLARFKRWSIEGVYYCELTVRPGLLWGYEQFVKPEV